MARTRNELEQVKPGEWYWLQFAAFMPKVHPESIPELRTGGRYALDICPQPVQLGQQSKKSSQPIAAQYEPNANCDFRSTRRGDYFMNRDGRLTQLGLGL